MCFQWNIGQETLQPLLSEMFQGNADEMASLFQDHSAELATILNSPRDAQLEWARSIQDTTHKILQPWASFFQALGRTPEFQTIQMKHADQIRQSSLNMCTQYGLKTERGLALMFDICVQNGSIDSETDTKIRQDFASISTVASPFDQELARLQCVANRRAEACRPEYVEDVRARKLTIANGTGTVHGMSYNLEQQFGIRLIAFAEQAEDASA